MDRLCLLWVSESVGFVFSFLEGFLSRKKQKKNYAYVGATILFGMTVFPKTKNQNEDMERLRRRMLRRIIIGLRRIDGEEWKETMQRMNLRLSPGLDLYYCKPWSISFARNQ